MPRRNSSVLRVPSNHSMMAVAGRTKYDAKFEDKQAEEALALRRSTDHFRMTTAKEPPGPTAPRNSSPPEPTAQIEVRRHASVVRSASLRQGLHMGERVTDGINNIRARASHLSQGGDLPTSSSIPMKPKSMALSLLHESSSFLGDPRDKSGVITEGGSRAIPRVQDDFEGLHWLLHRIVVHSKHFAKHIKRLHELKESQDSRMKRELKRLVSCSLEEYIDTYHDLLDEEELHAAAARHRRNARNESIENSAGKGDGSRDPFHTGDLKSMKEQGGTETGAGVLDGTSANPSGSQTENGDIVTNRGGKKKAAPLVIELTDDAIEEARYGNDWDIRSAKQTVLTNVSKAIAKNQRMRGQVAKVYAKSMWTSIHEKSYQEYRRTRMGQANLKAVCTPSVMMANFLCLQDFRKAQEQSAKRIADAEAKKKELAKKLEQELLFPVSQDPSVAHDGTGTEELHKRHSLRTSGPLVPIDEDNGRRNSLAEERARSLRIDAIRGFLAKNNTKQIPRKRTRIGNAETNDCGNTNKPDGNDDDPSDRNPTTEQRTGPDDHQVPTVSETQLNYFKEDLAIDDQFSFMSSSLPNNKADNNDISGFTSPSQATKAAKARMLEKHIEQRLREWQYERELNKTLGFESTIPLPGSAQSKQRKARSILGLTREEEESAKMMIAAFIVSRHEKQVKVYMHERELYLKRRMAKQKRFVSVRHERIAKEYNMKLVREKFQSELVRTKRRLHRLDVKKAYLARYRRNANDEEPPGADDADPVESTNVEHSRLRMDSIRRRFGINQRGIDVERTKTMAKEYSLKVRTRGGGWKPQRSKDSRILKRSTLHMQRIFRGHVARVYAWAMGWILDPTHMNRIFQRYKSSPQADGISDPLKLQQLLRDLGKHLEEEEQSELWNYLCNLEVVNGNVVPKRRATASLHTVNPSVRFEVFLKYWRQSRNRDIGVGEMLRFSQIAKAQRKREIAEIRSKGRDTVKAPGLRNRMNSPTSHNNRWDGNASGSPTRISEGDGDDTTEHAPPQTVVNNSSRTLTRHGDHAEVVRRSANQAARDYLTVRRLHREQRSVQKKLNPRSMGHAKRGSSSSRKLTMGEQLELAGHYALKRDKSTKNPIEHSSSSRRLSGRPASAAARYNRKGSMKRNRGPLSPAGRVMRKSISSKAFVEGPSSSQKPSKEEAASKNVMDIHKACEELRNTDDFQKREEINRELFNYLQQSRARLHDASRQLWTDKTAALQEVLSVIRDTSIPAGLSTAEENLVNVQEMDDYPSSTSPGTRQLARSKTIAVRDNRRVSGKKGAASTRHLDTMNYDEFKLKKTRGDKRSTKAIRPKSAQVDRKDIGHPESKHWTEKMRRERVQDPAGSVGSFGTDAVGNKKASKRSNQKTVMLSTRAYLKDKESFGDDVRKEPMFNLKSSRRKLRHQQDKEGKGLTEEIGQIDSMLILLNKK